MLNTYDNFTLNSIFRPKAIIKKTRTSMSTTRWWNRDYVVDIEVHVFLDKGLLPKYWIKSKMYNDNLKRFVTDSEQSLN